MRRHALETEFYFNTLNEAYSVPPNLNSYEKSNNNSFNEHFRVAYAYYLNTKSRQSKINSTFIIDTYNSTYKLDKNVKYKSSEINPEFLLESENRWYKEKNWFFESDYQTSYSYYHIKIETNYNGMQTFGDNQHILLVQLPFKVGKGRIEQVQDARQAIYLFDELSKQERIKAGLTNDDILNFSKFISELKNERFFDSQIRKIHEIEAIDSFINANGYALKADSRYFTTLNDFWTYGDMPLRNAGNRISFGVLPGYQYYFSEDIKTLEKVNSNAYFVNVGIEYIHEKPLSLLWQNTIEMFGYTGLFNADLKYNIFNNTTNLNIPNIQLKYKQKIGFYPNIRTSLEYSYAIDYTKLFPTTGTFPTAGFGLRFSSDLAINYYVSPKLRLSFNSGLFYTWQDSEAERNINFDNITTGDFQTNTLIYSVYGSSGQYTLNRFSSNIYFKITYSIF